MTFTCQGQGCLWAARCLGWGEAPYMREPEGNCLCQPTLWPWAGAHRLQLSATRPWNETRCGGHREAICQAERDCARVCAKPEGGKGAKPAQQGREDRMLHRPFEARIVPFLLQASQDGSPGEASGAKGHRRCLGCLGSMRNGVLPSQEELWQQEGQARQIHLPTAGSV